MKINKKIVVIEMIFLAVLLSSVYFIYPKVDFEVTGNSVMFDSANTEFIIISENPDFSNPRYIDLTTNKNALFELAPGTYYWKASNNFISGWERQFTIDSEVGMAIENESLINAGNVKINVTKEGGKLVGNIILDPDEKEEVEDKPGVKYTGRQDE